MINGTTDENEFWDRVDAEHAELEKRERQSDIDSEDTMMAMYLSTTVEALRARWQEEAVREGRSVDMIRVRVAIIPCIRIC